MVCVNWKVLATLLGLALVHPPTSWAEQGSEGPGGPSPLSLAIIVKGEGPKAEVGALILERSLREFIREDARFEVIPSEEIENQLSDSGLELPSDMDEITAIQTGRAIGVERMMLGEVARMEENLWRATLILVDVRQEILLTSDWLVHRGPFPYFSGKDIHGLFPRMIPEKPDPARPHLTTEVGSPSFQTAQSPEPNQVEEPEPPPEKSIGDEKNDPLPAPKPPKISDYRLTLIFPELGTLDLEGNSANGTVNEGIATTGGALAFDWEFYRWDRNSLSMYAGFGYGYVTEVISSAPHPSSSGTSGDGSREYEDERGIMRIWDLGMGFKFFPYEEDENIKLKRIRHQVILSYSSLSLRYDITEPNSTGGMRHEWILQLSGFGLKYKLDHEWPFGLSLGAILQFDLYKSIHGSRAEALNREGVALSSASLYRLGGRVGYAF